MRSAAPRLPNRIFNLRGYLRPAPFAKIALQSTVSSLQLVNYPANRNATKMINVKGSNSISDGGWLFKHGDERLYVYIDDVDAATKLAIRQFQDHAPEGEVQRISGPVFRDFFDINVGEFVKGRVYRQS